MLWNLAVRRFLLAVILVSGSETAVQNQLLTVWVAVCWCRGIISPTTVPSNLLPGIVSKKNKEKKNAISIFSLWSFDCFSNYCCRKGSDPVVFHKNIETKLVKIILCGPWWRMTLDVTDRSAGSGGLSFSMNSTDGCRFRVKMKKMWFILLISM